MLGRAGLEGRDNEQARLRHVLDLIAAGRMAIAAVRGEPGIGKSALIAELGAAARAASATVLAANGIELARDHPFRLATAALAPIAPEATGEALLDALEAAADGPTVLLLDDLQWADHASLGFVHDVTRRLADRPLAVVVAHRTPAPFPVDRLVGDLQRRGGDLVDLGPLAPDAVDRLALAALGAPAGPVLRSVLEGARGNPLFVLELLGMLDDEGALRRDAVAVDLDPRSPVVPASLRVTLRRHLAGESPATLDVLRVASVLGTSFAATELALVLGRPVAALIRELRDATSRGILDDAGDELAFRHDLLREALYEELDEEARVALHREIARVLRQAGATPHRVVPHALRAAATADDADRLLELADEVRHVDFALSMTVLEHVLDLLPVGDARRDEAVAALVVPLVRQGRAADAIALADEVLDRAHDPALDGALLEGIAFAGARVGAPATHRERLEVTYGSPRLDTPAAARLAAFLAEARLMTGDAAGARSLGEAVLRDPSASADADIRVYTLGTLSWAEAAHGNVDRAVALAQEGVLRHRQAVAPQFGVDVHLGVALIEADAVDDAAHRLRDGLRYDSERGDRAALAYYHFGLLGCGYLRGTWDDAIADAEAGLSLVEDGVGPPWVATLGHALLARLAIHRNDLARADALLRRGEEALAALGPHVGADFLLWSRALLLEACGDRAAATSLLRFEWEATASMRYFLSWRTIAPDLVRLLVAQGDEDAAATVASEAEEGARRAPGIASAEAVARRCRGLLVGDGDALLDAAELYGTARREPDAAAALEDAGRALAASGRVDAGVDALRRALDRFESLGAPFDAARVAAALAELGADRPRRPRRPSFGWDSLTPTELRVVGLVAEGRTNREIADALFLSRYTIETHLKHVFVKLGVVSRAELAAAAHQRV